MQAACQEDEPETWFERFLAQAYFLCVLVAFCAMPGRWPTTVGRVALWSLFALIVLLLFQEFVKGIRDAGAGRADPKRIDVSDENNTFLGWLLDHLIGYGLIAICLSGPQLLSSAYYFVALYAMVATYAAHLGLEFLKGVADAGGWNSSATKTGIN